MKIFKSVPKLFSKQESTAICIILAVLIVISLFNFRIALRRQRDNERVNDLGDIAKALDQYKEKFALYPTNLDDLTAVMKVVPKDPGTPKGYSYLYFTDGRYFQIYASLEGGADESQYSPVIEKRNLKCGNFVCSYGKASGSVPLDKTIQEYENELEAKNEKK